MVFAGYLNTGCRRYANAAKRTLCSERILRTSNGFLTKKTTNASRLFSASPLRTAAKEKIDNAYSHTLCLPKTALPNRRSAEVEQSLRERFDILYKWQLENNPGKLFILHDGPPYANGNLHIGHALNKILKDIIIRYHILQGRKVHYIPGWDCHGLPIELKALSNLRGKEPSANEAGKLNSDEIAGLLPIELRAIAKREALSAVALQREEFRSWGILGDWENAYKTLDPEYEVRQLHVFQEMVKRGLIYRQYKPVYWSPSSRTALADAELEYYDHRSRSLYVQFPMENFEGGKNASLVAWTTTPWTLPSNKALAINPNLKYAVLSLTRGPEIPKERCIVADELVESFTNVLDPSWQTLKVGELEGSALLGRTYCHPITGEKNMPIISAAHVTSLSGTGVVHIAPAHGVEDYEACRKLNMKTICLVDEKGLFTSEAGVALSGKEIHEEGTNVIIDQLREKGLLLAEKAFIHKYPCDWRTKKPVIQRATAQWFANVESIQEQSAQAIQNVTMIPENGRQRLEPYIYGRSEWCISRQRSWGVPIPVLYDVETDEPLLTDASVGHIISVVEKEGCDAWWKLDVKELLAPEYQSNGRSYRKGYDTMDVWFDSGVSWAMLPSREGLPKADLYLEGSDQHRGWFLSSLLTSIGASGKAPYSTVITHGFVLDGDNRKMSKSIGNVIGPNEIVRGGKKTPAYGPDVLRMWVAGSDYSVDVSIGKTVMDQTSEILRKIRNTSRFMLGSLADFHAKDALDYEELQPEDKYILHELYHFSEMVTSAYEQYTFHRATSMIYQFTTGVLSAFYLSIIKNRLYVDSPKSHSRLAVQTTLFHILDTYTKLVAPIACHLGEEVYGNYREKTISPRESVFQSGWVQQDERWNNMEIKRDFEALMDLREHVLREMADARKDGFIKQSQETMLELYAPEAPMRDILHRYASRLAEIFVTSKVIITDRQPNEAEKYQGSAIVKYNDLECSCHFNVLHSPDHKCPRCWTYLAASREKLCPRCEEVLARATM